MSARLASRLLPSARAAAPSLRSATPGRAGGLLRSDWTIRRMRSPSWPPGFNGLHNVPAVRTISFARILPSIVTKMARLSAVAGGATVAGLSYIQYQAGQAGTYAMDVYSRAKATTTDFAGNLYSGATDAFEQTKRGWRRKTDEIEMPEWMQQIFTSKEGESSSGGNGGPDPGKQPKKASAGVVAGAGATSAAFGYDSDSEDDDRQDEDVARDDQMMLLTKKMIEIRGLLQTVGKSETLTLPSIVVIGSQSSGKSSVLEAIVGHEFLPKGSNMVTRRPIELTLVNTPRAKAEYGEFPALGLGKITDFSHIQKTLTDLNLAVPKEDCVTDDPIQLRIYSPHVPDLSLIDLPGYIQVTGRDQPPELKERIRELCHKYIQPPNVILAISAADVDLANSTSLRASRQVDPRGERTIGVITKMDLVEPERGSDMLNDKKYPLRLGYVGVVSRLPPASNSLFNRGSGNIQGAISKNERAFFSAHPSQFGSDAGVDVGTTSLRKKLMRVLEQTMASSLRSTEEAIQQELAEATYEFKVRYSERPLSAESYLAESLDAFKHSFMDFTESFGRPQVRELLKRELDQQFLNILAQKYWNIPFDDLSPPLPESHPLSALPKSDPDDQLWHVKLDSSIESLTKIGLGRLATTVVASSLQAHIDQLVAQSTFNAHPFGRKAIQDASTSILRGLSYGVSDELEICVKPYKTRIELDDLEWKRGKENVGNVLKEELRVCEGAVKHVEEQMGGRKKMRDVIAFIDRVRDGQTILEGNGVGGAGGFSAALLEKGREAVFLRDRSEIIKMRMAAVKSKQCNDKKNKYYCPEVFLDAVADKLTSTADLFLDAELLTKYYYLFPRELDARLGRGLSDTELERFAREDPKIRHHLDVVRRKDLLEHVLREMDSLRELEAREKRYKNRSSQTEGDGRKGRGWSLF